MVDPGPAADALLEARPTGNGWFRVNCPYCLDQTGKSDRRQSLGIKPEINFFSCFKCGVRGRLPDDDDRIVDFRTPLPEGVELPPLPEDYEPLWDDAWTSITFEEPVAYVKRRGITREIAEAAKIGACASGKYAGRVVVPCLDLDGETWLGFSARDWTDKAELKYTYPFGMPRQLFMYNQVELYRETNEPVMIVEGVFDALPYWPGVVACLGKPVDNHFKLMLEASRPIAVCLDGDAWEEAWSLSEQLRLYGKTAGYVQLPPRKDPNTVSKGWLVEEARKCVK